MADREFLALLNNSFRVLREIRIPDGYGGWVTQWKEVNQIRGRLSITGTRPNEQIMNYQYHALIDHILFVEAGVDIQRGDRIVVDNGRQLRVVAVKNPSRANHHLEIAMEEMQRPPSLLIEGIMAATSAMAGHLGLDMRLFGLVDEESGVFGMLGLDLPITGQINAETTASGVLLVAQGLMFGLLGAITDSSGHVMVDRRAGGLADAAGAIAGALMVAKLMTAELGASTTVSGGLRTHWALQTELTSMTELAGRLIAEQIMTGETQATATVLAGLGLTVRPDGTVTDTSDLTGSLLIDKLYQGIAAAVANLAGQLATQWALTAEAENASDMTSPLSVAWSMAGVLDAAADVTGVLLTDRLCAGSMDASGAISAVDLRQGRRIPGFMAAASEHEAQPRLIMRTPGEVHSDGAMAAYSRIRRLIQGESNGSSDISAVLRAVKLATGELQTTSTLDAMAKIERELAGDGVSSTELLATLRHLFTVAGNMDVQSAVDGTTRLTMRVDGDLAAASELSAWLSVAQALLRGAIDAETFMEASAQIARRMVGSVENTAVVDALLTISWLLASGVESSTAMDSLLRRLMVLMPEVIEANSNGTSRIRVLRQLLGMLTAVADHSGDLVLDIGLMGEIDPQSVLGATPTVDWRLDGSMTQPTDFLGFTPVDRKMAAEAAADSDLTSNLAVGNVFAGSIDSSGQIVASMQAHKLMHGVLSCVTELSAYLFTFTGMQGSVTDATTLLAHLTTFVGLQGKSSATSLIAGRIADVALSGAIAATAGVVAELATIKPLAGLLSAQETTGGRMTAARRLEGAPVEAAVQLTANLTVLRTAVLLEGTIPASSAVTGAVKPIRGVEGSIAAAATVGASLSVYPILTQTDFNSYATGAQPTGWTSRWNNQGTYAIVDLGGGNKILRETSTADGNRFLSWDNIGQPVDVDVLVKARKSNTSGRANRVIARASGADGTETGYYVELSGGSFVNVRKAVNGTHTTIQSVGFTWSADTWYWMRFRVAGSQLSAKVWQVGSAEPTSWLLDTSDEEIVSGGYVGVGNFAQSANKDFDDFSCRELARVQTDFSEYTTDNVPHDWHEVFDNTNQTWAVREKAFTTGGKVLEHTQSVQAHRLLAWDRAGRVMNVQGLMKFRFTVANGSLSTMYLRATTDQTYYSGKAHPTLGRQIIYRYLTGSPSTVSSATFSFSANTWYWMKFRVEGNNQFLKLWADGASEPTSWAVIGSNSEITAAGLFGVGNFTVDGVRDFDIVRIIWLPYS